MKANDGMEGILLTGYSQSVCRCGKGCQSLSWSHEPTEQSTQVERSMRTMISRAYCVVQDSRKVRSSLCWKVYSQTERALHDKVQTRPRSIFLSYMVGKTSMSVSPYVHHLKEL